MDRQRKMICERYMAKLAKLKEKNASEEELQEFKAKQLKAHLELRSISYIRQLPSPFTFLDGFLCAVCHILVLNEYLLCETEGHLTCQKCRNKGWISSCQFRVHKPPPPPAALQPRKKRGTDQKESEGPLKKTSEEDSSSTCDSSHWIPCGARLLNRRHAFVENMQASIRLYCIFYDRGCRETVAANLLRKHIRQCAYRSKPIMKAPSPDDSNPGSPVTASASSGPVNNPESPVAASTSSGPVTDVDPGVDVDDTLEAETASTTSNSNRTDVDVNSCSSFESIPPIPVWPHQHTSLEDLMRLVVIPNAPLMRASSESSDDGEGHL